MKESRERAEIKIREENLELIDEICRLCREDIGVRKTNSFIEQYCRMQKQGVDILLPVPEASQEMKEKIHTVLNSEFSSFRLWLMEAAGKSEQDAVMEMLEDYKNNPRVRIVENNDGQGILEVVNRGIRLADGDLIIMGEKIQVAPGWLEGIIRAAAYNPKAATVTPYFAEEGIYRFTGETFLNKESFLRTAESVRKTFGGIYLKVPSGCADCIFIRREALQSIKEQKGFNAEDYRDIYYAGVEFSICCVRAGWEHIVAASVCVYQPALSREDKKLRERDRRILEQKFPDFPAKIQTWLKNSKWERRKMQQYQRSNIYLQIERQAESVCKKRILLAANTMEALSEEEKEILERMGKNYDFYFLIGMKSKMLLCYYHYRELIPLKRYLLEEEHQDPVLRSLEREAIYREILCIYQIHLVHVRQLGGHTFDLPAECRKMNIPSILSFEDFYAVCPSYHLLDGKREYCGGDCGKSEESCSFSKGWMNNFQGDFRKEIPLWRRKMSRYLLLFDSYTIPCRAAGEILEKVYPFLHGQLLLLEPPVQAKSKKGKRKTQSFSAGAPIKLLVMGEIGISQGVKTLKRLLELDKEGKIEIHLIGRISDSQIKKHEKVTMYSQEEKRIEILVEEISPHFGLVCDIWPEISGRAVRRFWSWNLPVIASRIGAAEELITDQKGGWLYEPSDAEELYELLVHRITREEYREKAETAARIMQKDFEQTAKEYLHLYISAEKRILEFEMPAALANRERLGHAALEEIYQYIREQKQEKQMNAQLIEIQKNRIQILEREYEGSMNCYRRRLGNAVADSLGNSVSMLKMPGQIYQIFREYQKEKRKAPSVEIASEKKEEGPVNFWDADSSEGIRGKMSEEPYQVIKEKYTVSVVVCIHNALEYVRVCLKSLWEERTFPYEMILVDDGSQEETGKWVEAFAQNTDSILIRHEQAKGYTISANEGMKQAKGDYIVLLNSDTQVTAGWIEKMLDAFWKHPDTGILSPLSNAATYQSVPVVSDKNGWFINTIPENMNIRMMNLAVEEASSKEYPQVKCVNGFCFMIHRKVIQKIGYLDEATFPRGYGEEVDYCLRVLKAGYEIRVLDDTYIYHAKSKSFTEKGRKILNDQSKGPLLQKHGKAALDDIGQSYSRCLSLEKTRSNIRVQIERMQMVMEKLKGKRIGFLLIAKGASGGANSVCQEAKAMRSMGLDVWMINRKKNRQEFLENYPEWEQHTVWYDKKLEELGKSYDMVIGTIFVGMELIAEYKNYHPKVKVAYYVQDYEPLFFEREHPFYEQALKSYDLIENTLLFAKTRWLCDYVEEKHPGLSVHKVSPSIDTSLYNPFVRKDKKVEEPYKITAMLRPKTPRRNPEGTLQVLEKIWKELGEKVQILIFGCEEGELFPYSKWLNFQFINYGVLKRWEVAGLLAESDIFIDLSVYQAFGRTGLEGMCFGCVPVLPEKGGVREYARDQENALIVDTCDVQGVAEKVIGLCKDPGKLKDMSEEGIRTARQYSVIKAAWSEIRILSRLF